MSGQVHRCTTVQQGYGSHTTHQCLPHTGVDLSVLGMFAFGIVAAGLLLREVARPQKRRRKDWTEWERASRGDWEDGLRTFDEAGAAPRPHASKEQS